MTLLGGNKLRNAPLFAKGGTEIRDSSVDLTIGSIFNERGDNVGPKCILRPGEMLLVASADVLQLPNNVTGIVSCKTSLTHLGVWAITVGIVDPCWCGPVSTTLVNFGANAQVIRKGMPFLRVAFFEHEAVRPPCASVNAERKEREYLSDVLHNSVRFEKTFMDINKIVEKAGEKAFKEMRNSLVVWATIIGVAFAGLQAAGAFGASDEGGMQALQQRLDRIEARLPNP